MPKEQYLAWLKQDELEILLKTLEKDAIAQNRQTIYEESLQLSSRFYRLEKQRLRKTATEEELEVERNKIREALTSLVEQLDKPGEKASEIGQKFNWKRWRPLALMFFLSFVLVSLSLLPVRSVNFRIALKTEYLAFRLADQPIHEIALQGKRAEFYPLTKISGSSWSYGADDGEGQPLDAQLDTGWLSLEGLKLESETGISIRISGQDLTLAFDAPVSGRLQADDSQVKVSLADTIHIADPDLIEWALEAGGEANIALRPDSAVKLLRLPIQAIDFQRRVTPGGETLKSAIQGGSIFIGNSINSLSIADQLLIGGLKHAELNLYSRGQVIQVDLTGQARELRSGLERLRSHKPNWLVYFQSDQLIVLIFSALTYVISLLWAIWKTIYPPPGK